MKYVFLNLPKFLVYVSVFLTPSTDILFPLPRK